MGIAQEGSAWGT
ncbi:uncharacterized, partial [Tachysurus ichikawai]